MSLRFTSLVLAIGASLALASCHPRGEDDSSDDTGPSLEVISVAVGAEVTLLLAQSSCDDSLVNGCLAERPFKLDGVSLSDEGPFELGTAILDNGTVQVKVRARSAGETTLTVDHQDFADRPMRDQILLRAAEITHVKALVGCDKDVAELPRYPLTSGSKLSIELTAMAGDTPLASGAMELIESADGFDVQGEPGTPRQVQAPEKPGKYAWDLIGTTGVEFAIYDPADLELKLSEEEGGVRVGRVIDGVPVCHHEGAARASIEVTKGSCLPYVHGYEIEGELPVDMALGDFVLELSGKDSCELSATLDGAAKGVSLTVAVDNLAEPPQPGVGDPLTAEPTAVGGVAEEREPCPTIKNISNGACEIIDGDGFAIPDGDCFLDWDWVKELYVVDNYEETLLENPKVGLGLLVELRVGVRYEFISLDFGTFSTNDLKFSAKPADGLAIKNLGCIGSERQVLAIRPEAAGDYTIDLDADNVYEKSAYAVHAAAVSSVKYETDASDVKKISGGTQAFWFVGAMTRFKASYAGAGGGKLAGAAPILVSSEAGGSDATVHGYRVYTGTKPTVVRLASEVAPSVHLMNVVDGSAIGAIGGLMPASFVAGLDGCLEAFPSEAGGARIHGNSPVRPRATISGTAVVVNAQRFSPQNLCLRGEEAGTSDIGVSWGAATAQTTFTVK